MKSDKFAVIVTFGEDDAEVDTDTQVFGPFASEADARTWAESRPLPFTITRLVPSK